MVEIFFDFSIFYCYFLCVFFNYYFVCVYGKRYNFAAGRNQRIGNNGYLMRTAKNIRRVWERECRKRKGKRWKPEKSETGNWKVQRLKKGRRKRTRKKKSKGGGKEKRHKCGRVEEGIRRKKRGKGKARKKPGSQPPT